MTGDFYISGGTIVLIRVIILLLDLIRPFMR